MRAPRILESLYYGEVLTCTHQYLINCIVVIYYINSSNIKKLAKYLIMTNVTTQPLQSTGVLSLSVKC